MSINIHQIAQKIAEQLAASECSQPFGTQYDVYKLLNHIYLIAFELNGLPTLNVKVDPLQGEMLRDFYPFIRTGYHMNKRHWISIYTHEDVTVELLEDLIRSSYQLVSHKLTKIQKQHLALIQSIP